MLTDEQIQALIVRYNKQRRHAAGERAYMVNTWCHPTEFDMLKRIIADSEPLGFTGWCHDQSRGYLRFITCYYGPIKCRVDLSRQCHGIRQPQYDSELEYLVEHAALCPIDSSRSIIMPCMVVNLATWRWYHNEPELQLLWDGGQPRSPFRMERLIFGVRGR